MPLFIDFILAVGLILAVIGLFLVPYLHYLEQLKKDRELLLTVTNLHRGTDSERKLVLRLLKLGIPAKTIFHDLYLETSYKRFAQIDLVVPTKVGIIVFEVKEYSGWIFGSGHQKEWTQILAFGKQKFRLYNPVIQNKKHIERLRLKLPQFANVPFFSVVVFYGSCEFKNVTQIPQDVFLIKAWDVASILDQILTGNPLAHYENKWEIVQLLAQATSNGDNLDVRWQHIQNLRAIEPVDNQRNVSNEYIVPFPSIWRLKPKFWRF
ncbi:MAG: NERD domain-containing protein [Sphingomonadales bacterium]|nr:NERD domain-containing protein [Sphingomonadales bacterium]